MTDPHYKPFSEYRHKDYVTPRSMKEAYGHEPVLYTDEEEREVRGVIIALLYSLAVSFSVLVGYFFWM